MSRRSKSKGGRNQAVLLYGIFRFSKYYSITHRSFLESLPNIPNNLKKNEDLVCSMDEILLTKEISSITLQLSNFERNFGTQTRVTINSHYVVLGITGLRKLEKCDQSTSQAPLIVDQSFTTCMYFHSTYTTFTGTRKPSLFGKQN